MNKLRRLVGQLVLVALAQFALVSSALAQQTSGTESATVAGGDAGAISIEDLNRVLPDRRAYSPAVNRNFPVRPLFGDTHLHTAFSLDAGLAGARLGPREAYQFARGDSVVSNTGLPVQLSRPLDFLVVADHSDLMGFFPLLSAGDPKMLADPTGRKWYNLLQSGKGAEAAFEVISAFSAGKFPKALTVDPGKPVYQSVWKQIIDAAEEYNDPGRFTAVIGYEWTSQAANNIHRNILYRDGGNLARAMDPFTVTPPLGSPLDTALCRWMEEYEARTGGNVLAIAHNGNVSNGLICSPSSNRSPINLSIRLT